MQQRLKTYLQQVMQAKHISHAYILEGPRGIGKKTLAREFAAGLFCESPHGPCKHCPGCLKFYSGNHPDFKWIEKRPDKSDIVIEQIRQMTEDVYIKPFLAERKVYVIDEAHLLNTAAQNAMLKIFEEPPRFATILLLTDQLDQLLATIQSRAVILRLSPWTADEIKAFIGREYPQYAFMAGTLAGLSSGVVGKAKAFCENDDFAAMRKALYEAIPLFLKGKAYTFTLRDIFVTYKADFEQISELFLLYFRDCIALKLGASALINEDYREQIAAFAAKYGAGSLTRMVSRYADLLANAAKRGNYELLVTELMLNCWEELNGAGSRSAV